MEETILDLHRELSLRNAEITVLKNKLLLANLALDTSIMNNEKDDSDADIPDIPEIPKKERIKSKKMKFYEEHKDDPLVLEQVELFNTTFPGIKIPKQLIKAFVYDLYKE
jgi:hypothetical protein